VLGGGVSDGAGSAGLNTLLYANLGKEKETFLSKTPPLGPPLLTEPTHCRDPQSSGQSSPTNCGALHLQLQAMETAIMTSR
jgi:hypothetical protein